MAPMPFVWMAQQYFDAGWSPLPLPYKEKSPVPNGYTGASGSYVTDTDLARWLKKRARINVGNFNYAPGNIALRLPRNVIGIDVDAYSGKTGLESLEAALDEWGPLPATWVTTSKEDGVSGIRLFRIPEGLAWPGELPQGKGVELLRWDHRFAIVYPSIHDKTGAEYAWLQQVPGDGPGGLDLVASPDDFPTPGDLPELPEAWVEGLTSGQRWEERAAADITEAEANAWLSSCVEPEDLCAYMRKTISTHTKLLRLAGEDGGGHDAGRDAAWAVLGDANDGHGGVKTALGKLRDVFLAAVRKRRGDERQAREEWRRAVFRGIAKIIEGGGRELADPCTSLVAIGDSNDPLFDFTEFGNTQRLARVLNGKARWVPGLKCWYIWDTVRWVPDPEGSQVNRWAWKAIDLIEEEIARLGGTADDDTIGEFKKHKKKSSTKAQVAAMVGLVRDRQGMALPAESLDANPRLLTTPNGRLELTDSGTEFSRRQRAEDYMTRVTSAPYDPDATSELWDDYLGKFFPDPEMRAWLQLLIGYSLFGANDEQIMVIGHGLTGTGKTTFKMAIEAALGDYAGVLEKSIFRANTDDKARPDILKAMGRRIVISEEFSASDKLHVDQIKYITGAGDISARGMASNVFVERTPTFTPWLLTNEFPQIAGGDLALVNRVLVVPFGAAMIRTQESARKRRRLLEEPGAPSAVLSWAVGGWNAYCAGKALRDVPASALEANARFLSELSEFHAFLSECCDRGPEYSEPSQLLFEAYEEWCGYNRIKERDQLNVNTFGRQLSAMGIGRDRARTDGVRVQVRTGVRLAKRAGAKL
jgi:putative DNA primase/helicase